MSSNMDKYSILEKSKKKNLEKFTEQEIKKVVITGGGSVSELGKDNPVSKVTFNTDKKTKELISITVDDVVYPVKDTVTSVFVDETEYESTPVEFITEVVNEETKIKSIKVKDKTYDLIGKDIEIKLDENDVSKMIIKTTDGEITSFVVNGTEFEINVSGSNITLNGEETEAVDIKTNDKNELQSITVGEKEITLPSGNSNIEVKLNDENQTLINFKVANNNKLESITVGEKEITLPSDSNIEVKLNDEDQTSIKFKVNDDNKLESITVGEKEITLPVGNNIEIKLNEEAANIITFKTTEDGDKKILSAITIGENEISIPKGDSGSNITMNNEKTEKVDINTDTSSKKVKYITIDGEEYKFPTSDGGEESAVIETEVPLMKDYGAIKAGTKVNGKTLMELFLKGFIPPTSPDISSFTISPATKLYEIGSNISFKPSAIVKPMTNPITSVLFYLNDAQIGTVSKTENTYTLEDNIEISNGDTKQTVKIVAKDGKLQDTVKTIDINFKRAAFYGTTNTTDMFSTSSQVRSLSKKLLDPKAGTTFTINIPVGTSMVVFALPGNLDVSKVEYIEGMNADVKSIFSRSSIEVEGANEYETTMYTVFTYIPAGIYSSECNYKVTVK